MPLTIIITGASGLIASKLTKQLLRETNCKLILISRNTNKIKARLQTDRVTSLTIDELAGFTATQVLQHADICVHTAFARSKDARQLAESLEYTSLICNICKQLDVAKFINISSQSVYGNDHPLGISEEYPCAPSYMYAVCKYSSEIICESIFENSATQLYNIRLSSVSENARFFCGFCQNALNHIPITVTAPRQIVSFIDPLDVVSALITIITNIDAPTGIYNLGTGEWYDIKTVAQCVARIGKDRFGIEDITISVEDNGNEQKVGMRIDKFSKTFNWKPRYSFEDMVEHTYLIKKNG